MISEKEIEKIAKLAKIKLEKKELPKFQKDVQKILEYVEKLKKLDVEGIEPMSHSVWVENVMRKDEEVLGWKENFAKIEKLIFSFSEKEAGFLKTKKIIKK